MHLRLLLAVCVWGACLSGTVRSQSSGNEDSSDGSPVLRSSVQAMGVGTVSLKPTILRLSIPVKILSEDAWDATESLRNTRRSIVERATEMGAIEGTLQVFGFQCAPEPANPISSIRGDSGKPKFAAQCFVVADFPLREGEDFEETVGLSQAQLTQLASLLPEPEAGRRSYSVSSLSSGFTSQQLESPLAIFVAKVTAEDRAKAFNQALESARAQVQTTLAALGIEATALSITQSPIYSSSRPAHPLETMLEGNKFDEATGVCADSVFYTVRLSVAGQFNHEN